MYSGSVLALFLLGFILGFMSVSCKAAPANVTDIVDLPDLLRTERAERLRLQTELDSLTTKFTELEGTLHMQRDGGKV